MTDTTDLEASSRDLSKRGVKTVVLFCLAAASIVATVFTLPRGVLGISLFGVSDTSSVVLAIIGAVTLLVTGVFLWKWSRSLREQRKIERHINEMVAEAAGIIDADEITPPQS